MSQLTQFLLAHWTAIGFASYLLFMTAVDSMDEPDATSSKSYKFWYKFLHGVSMNWSKWKTPKV